MNLFQGCSWSQCWDVWEQATSSPLPILSQALLLSSVTSSLDILFIAHLTPTLPHRPNGLQAGWRWGSLIGWMDMSKQVLSMNDEGREDRCVVLLVGKSKEPATCLWFSPCIPFPNYADQDNTSSQTFGSFLGDLIHGDEGAQYMRMNLILKSSEKRNLTYVCTKR